MQKTNVTSSQITSSQTVNPLTQKKFAFFFYFLHLKSFRIQPTQKISQVKIC